MLYVRMSTQRQRAAYAAQSKQIQRVILYVRGASQFYTLVSLSLSLYRYKRASDSLLFYIIARTRARTCANGQRVCTDSANISSLPKVPRSKSPKHSTMYIFFLDKALGWPFLCSVLKYFPSVFLTISKIHLTIDASQRPFEIHRK